MIYFQEYLWIFWNFCKSIFTNKVLSYLSEYFLWLPLLLTLIYYLWFLYHLFGNKIIILISHNLNLILILINFLGFKFSKIIWRKFNPYYTVKTNYLNISATGDNGNNNSDNQTTFTWRNIAIGAVVVITISGTVVGIYYLGPDLVEIGKQAIRNYNASQPRYMLSENQSITADQASLVVALILNWLYQTYMWVPSIQELVTGNYLVKFELSSTGEILWNISKDAGKYIITGSMESGFKIVYHDLEAEAVLKFNSIINELVRTEVSEAAKFTINTTKSACNSIIRTVTTTIGEVDKVTNIEIYKVKPTYYIIKVLGLEIKARIDSSIILEITSRS